ncbi:serine/threonine-protein kinase [Cylindrospermopsis raciborskii DSH]|uniref:serine/threonine-protein kinase n=1 Tax=Cylindrospermopsis raciborskii TaxID=77022 RepID=UPI002ED8F352
MNYCFNPHCDQPANPEGVNYCLNCGANLLLKERYRSIKLIGQGGFGRTFLAVDEDKPSKPFCVIKQFYTQSSGKDTLQKAIQLFNQEAIRLDELGTHPQIPELLAYCTHEDRQYLVQEFINGLNLAQELVQNGAFTEDKIRQLLIDLLPVLQFCHHHQVIHRDIKPENIIRRTSDNKLVIVDFGAAKLNVGETRNLTGTSIGTPEYVAPEQMRGKAIFASDIYGLGVTCINLLTRRSPFDCYYSHEATWIWRKFLKTPITDDLGQIIDKMIAIIPSQRYQTVTDVIEDLKLQSISTPSSISIKNTVNIPTTIISPPKPPTSNQSHIPDVIDQELAEIKSKFLDNG